jgi:hypothetical protein
VELRFRRFFKHRLQEKSIHRDIYSRASIAFARLNGSVANTLEFSRKGAVGFIVD